MVFAAEACRIALCVPNCEIQVKERLSLPLGPDPATKMSLHSHSMVAGGLEEMS